jgi:hypothetical protein
MLACYHLLRFRLSSQLLHLIAGAFFALLMGILHKGLIVYAPFLVIVMLLVRVDRPGRRSSAWHVWFHRLTAVALAIGFVVGISKAEDQLREIGGAQLLLKATAGDGLVDHTEEARSGKALSDGRTAYGVSLDTSTPAHLVYSSIMILTYYMFAPFPWQIGHPRDLYAFAESLLRLAGLFAVFRMWRRGGPVQPQVVVLLMVVYLSMAFLWSAGTFTWGTATRHHMLHQWILLILGVPALLELRQRFARRHARAGSAQAASAPPSDEAPPEPHRAPPGGFGQTVFPPSRLGSLGAQPRALQMRHGAPCLSGAGFGRFRGLARE